MEVSWNLGDRKTRPPFATRYGSEYASYDTRYQQELAAHRNTQFAQSLTDRRTNEQYIYDLIDGWLVEDKVESLLREANILFRQSGGAGTGHVILPSSRVTNDFDYTLIVDEGIEYHLEVVSSNYDIAPLHVKRWKLDRATNQSVILFYIKPADCWYIVGPRRFSSARQKGSSYHAGFEAQVYELDSTLLGPRLTRQQVQSIIQKKVLGQ